MQLILKVVTANRLVDGEVVWLGGGGAWVETIDAALILASPEAVADAEKTAAQAIAANQVVDVETIDVTRDGQNIVPVRLREKIRALGPTIRTDLGKQAGPAARRSSDAA